MKKFLHVNNYSNKMNKETLKNLMKYGVSALFLATVNWKLDILYPFILALAEVYAINTCHSLIDILFEK